MSKKTKKAMSMLLVVTLVAVIAVGGMLAYLQSSDSDVNVMTLGNVSIKQHEYQRVENADGTYKTATIDERTSYVLEDFEQAKPLLPYVGVVPGNDPVNEQYDSTTVRMSQVDSYGGMQVFAGKNAQDKFVTVENKGKSDAYVRTLVALELGNLDAKDFDKIIGISARYTTKSDDYSQPWLKNEVGVVEIDGNNYVVVEYVYHGAKTSNGMKHGNGILPAGDTSYPNLCQVYMKSLATNEDCEAIDGNKNGTYDILVLSQAVQTNGFANAKAALDTGFGEVNTANVVKWFAGEEFEPPLLFTSYDTYYEYMYEGGDFVVANDIDSFDKLRFYPGVDVNFDLNGKNITAAKENEPLFWSESGGTLHLTGDGTVNMGKGIFATSGGKVTIDGGTYLMSNCSDKYHIYAQNSATVVINDGEFITSDPDAAIAYCINGFIEINGGFFQNTANSNKALLDMGNNLNYINNQKITLRGGTFVNWNPMDSAFAKPWTNPTVPALIVLDEGYKVVSETQSNGAVWYSVVPK